MTKAQKQINIRADDEFLAAIGEIQRADTASLTVPAVTDVIRTAVFEKRDRIRAAAAKRK